MRSKQVPKWMCSALIAIHLLALGWSLSARTWSFPDSDRYVQAAENLQVQGELYARPWLGTAIRGKAVQEYSIRPPGYPFMVLAIGGAERPVVLLLVQNIISLLSIVLVLQWWAKRTHPKSSHWIGAFFLISTFPGQFIYANALMSELLLQGVVVAMACMAILFTTTWQKRYFIGGCVAVSAALLIKPVFCPLALVMVLLGIGIAWKRKQPSLAVISFGPILIVWLYMSWNLNRTGYFHFSSIAEINLLHYNAAGVLRQTEGQQVAEQWVAEVLREADAQPDFAARQMLISKRAMGVLWAHPIVYTRQHVQGMLFFFLDPGRFDISQFLHLQPPVGGGFLAQRRASGVIAALRRLPVGLLLTLVSVALANGVRLSLAVRGFLLAKTSEPALRQSRWVIVGLVLYVALLTGPLGAARFLVPVWPLLLGFALMGLAPARLTDDSNAQEATAVGEHQR